MKFNLVLMTRLIYMFALMLVVACSGGNIEEDIQRQLDGMENAWRAGDKLGVSQFYTDDGYLLSGDKIAAQGRSEINSYWTDFRGKPLDWNLETFSISRDFEDIKQDARWQEVVENIPLWDDFDIKLPGDPIYHFGKSELSFQRLSNAVDTSIVNFLIVWQQTPDGPKIFLDTYD